MRERELQWNLAAQMKTFYIETFGCQMNVHDSEKVIGTLLAEGIRRSKTPEEADLSCTTPAASATKPNRRFSTGCSSSKRTRQGQDFRRARLRRATGRRKDFRARSARRVWLPDRRAITSCRRCWCNSRAGNHRVTGLSLDTDETFETPFTRRDNPHRAYITIIEGCDKSCAYCVVPFTRGPERSRTSESVLRKSRELAHMGYTEIQLLGQNVNSYRDPSPAGLGLRRAAARGRRSRRHPARPVHDFASARFRKDIIDAIDDNPVLCNHVHLPVQSGSSAMLERMQRLYTRDEYMRRIEWMKNARRNISITTDIIVGFPGETERDFEDTLDLLDEVQFDSLFSFKYSKRPNTPALAVWTITSRKKKRAAA